MKRSFIAGASVALLALAVASAAANFRFGWELGKSSSMTPWFHDGWIWGVVSVSFDVFKIVLGVVIVDALFAKGRGFQLRATLVLVATLAWMSITAYSLNSAFGTVLLSRTSGVGARTVTAKAENSLESAAAKLRASSPWPAEIMQWKELPSGAIAEKIEAHKIDPLWRTTAECARINVRSPEHRAYCQTYALLKMALAASVKSEKQDTRLTEIETALASGTGVTVADPQAKAYSDLTGVSEDKVRYVWSLILALLLEFVPNLGPGLLVMYAGLLDDSKTARSGGDREAGKAALTPALPLALTHEPKKEAPATRRAPRKTTKAIALTDPKVVSLSQRRAANDEKKTQAEPAPLDDIVEEAVSLIGPKEVDYQTIREAVLEAAKLRGWTKQPSNPEIGTAIKKRNHPSTRPYRKEGEITKRITLYDLSSRLPDAPSAEVAEA